ncbi:WD40/YVTN/BNR-like repeat-containing protein [Paraglaciecola arctica]|uniref:Glycosyl hydrolase, BNR repeat n=1 Tax=Paraglaciecola arctica BSs20135 TaxID=493475 RepID=K6YKD8_9ALTE|nr:YCF48-related protein [Paraglaciecola arctica]GAC18657.1 glycosyl hydrolase, BNR repeat [Paraglaciecola arctica BSs20135]
MDKVTAYREKPLQRTDSYQAFAKNDQVAVLVGNNGVVLTSHDAKTWSRTILAGMPSLIDIASCPDQRLIALSFDNQVWVSNINGDDWISIEVPTQEQLMTIDCAPNGNWWVAGGFSTFLHSANDGQNWQTTSLDEDAIITNLVFISEQDAVATAEFGMILVTENGGISWDLIGFLPDEFFPHSTHFATTAEGWVGGLNGFVYHTKDGGRNWLRQSADSSVPIYQFVQVDDALYALGDNATVMKLAGSNWQTVQPPTAPVYLRAALHFNGKLLVAGGRGMLLALDPNVVIVSAGKAEQSDEI